MKEFRLMTNNSIPELCPQGRRTPSEIPQCWQKRIGQEPGQRGNGGGRPRRRKRGHYLDTTLQSLARKEGQLLKACSCREDLPGGLCLAPGTPRQL